MKKSRDNIDIKQKHMTLSTNDIIHHKILLLHHLFHAFQSKTQRINDMKRQKG